MSGSRPAGGGTSTAKLPDADLRAFAASGDAAGRAVVVELADPTPAAPPAHLRRATLAPRAEAAARPDAADAGWPERMDDLERELVALHPGGRPVRLDLARSFALEVTPGVLRAIVRLPLVGVVRASRTSRPLAGG